ncbi:hypothetical protein R4Z09_12515 [Niallia oryzisoli]|uniref:Uncharacterized protein n=1 Tax=Niallia oryzisoli TaxID=1737571 RepID=A0ABZ2CJM3_9BACI
MPKGMGKGKGKGKGMAQPCCSPFNEIRTFFANNPDARQIAINFQNAQGVFTEEIFINSLNDFDVNNCTIIAERNVPGDTLLNCGILNTFYMPGSVNVVV